MCVLCVRFRSDVLCSFCFQALIGAIYLEHGLNVVKEFLWDHFISRYSFQGGLQILVRAVWFMTWFLVVVVVVVVVAVAVVVLVVVVVVVVVLVVVVVVVVVVVGLWLWFWFWSSLWLWLWLCAPKDLAGDEAGSHRRRKDAVGVDSILPIVQSGEQAARWCALAHFVAALC